MTTLTVWYLIALSTGNVQYPVQLGPFADAESCRRVRAALVAMPTWYVADRLTCVQVKAPK